MTWLYSIISSSDCPHYALRLFRHGFPECRTFYKMKPLYFTWASFKALANEDTLLGTHCCRHKCFPFCPCAQHLLQTQILCPGHKKCFWFCSETFCVRNKCFPVCVAQETSWATVRNNVSSFARAFRIATRRPWERFILINVLNWKKERA